MTDKAFEKQYFDNIYDKSYDRRNPRYKFKSYLRQIKTVQKKDSLLLDIGCAYGSFLKEAKRYYTVEGVDISSYAVDIAKSRFPDTKIWQSDLLSISEKKKYDVITCFDVIEHIPDIHGALHHLNNLLSNNGILIITVPVYDTLVGKLVVVLDKDPTHVHKNSRHWWINLVKKEGYDILNWKGIWRYYFKNVFYLHHINSLTRAFSPAIMIIAKKINRS